MADIDAEIESLRAELARLQAEPLTQAAPSTTTRSAWQIPYDIGTGALKAGAGLADLLTLPGVAIARAGGLNVPYFPASKVLSEDLAALAPQLGVKEATPLQEFTSFVTPIPGGKKAELAAQAGLGALGYLGKETGELVAPESPYAGVIGAGTAITGALGAGSLAKALAPQLTEAGKSLQRSAIGARASDFTKQARNQIIETIPGDFETQVKQSLDNVIEKKQLGSSADPSVLYSNLRQAKEATEDTIQNVLANVDATRTTGIIPRMDNVLEWIKTKAPATDVDFYKNEVNNFLKSLKEQGQGSLVYLNQQKKALAEKWKASPNADPTFWRLLYKDIKQTIEKQAPEVKDLNKAKQDLIVVEPILERGKRLAEQGATPKDLTRALLYTTGGLGVPAAYVMGGPVLGTALAGGLGLLGTRKGQQILGRTLEATGSALPTGISSMPNVASALSKLGTVQPQTAVNLNIETQPPLQTQADDVDAQIEALRKELETLRATPQESAEPTQVSALIEKQPPLIRAIIDVESKGKPAAKSGKGATGLMQLLPSTAEALGVDPKDPAQNIEGGTKYLAQMKEKFKNEKLALAAYNWGPGNLQKAINKTQKAGLKATWENILRTTFVPKETRQYVSKVLTLKNKYSV